MPRHTASQSNARRRPPRHEYLLPEVIFVSSARIHRLPNVSRCLFNGKSSPVAYFRDFRNPFPRYSCTKPCFSAFFTVHISIIACKTDFYRALKKREKKSGQRERERERERERAIFAISYFPNSSILMKNRSNILFARRNVHEELVSTCPKEKPRADISMQIKHRVKGDRIRISRRRILSRMFPEEWAGGLT